MTKSFKIRRAQPVTLYVTTAVIVTLGLLGTPVSSRAALPPEGSEEAAIRKRNNELGRAKFVEAERLRVEADRLLDRGEVVKAIATYQESLAIDVSNETYYGLARAYEKQGKNKEALDWRVKASERNGGNPEAAFGVALMLEEAGRYEEAVTAYNRGVRFLTPGGTTEQPGGGFSPLELPFDGKNLARKKFRAAALTGRAFFTRYAKSQQALADLREALTLQPDFPVALYVLGLEHEAGQADRVIPGPTRLDPQGARALYIRVLEHGEGKIRELAQARIDLIDFPKPGTGSPP